MKKRRFFSLIEILKQNRWSKQFQYCRDESPYLCSECGKAFKLAQTFDIHIQTHNKTFKFACSECPSRFNSKYLLKDHMVRSTETSFRKSWI